MNLSVFITLADYAKFVVHVLLVLFSEKDVCKDSWFLIDLDRGFLHVACFATMISIPSFGIGKYLIIVHFIWENT